jgi:hypothetical protein
MRTYIWADTNLDICNNEIYVAHADNVDDARKLIKNQLESELEFKKEYILKANSRYADAILANLRIDFDFVIYNIFRYEPSHIIGELMAARILHTNE